MIVRYRDTLSAHGEITRRRGIQARDWMWSDMTEILVDALKKEPKLERLLPELEVAVTEGRLPPTVAARELLDAFLDADRLLRL